MTTTGTATIVYTEWYQAVKHTVINTQRECHRFILKKSNYTHRRN